MTLLLELAFSYYLADAVMMRKAASISDNLISGLFLDLLVSLNRILDSIILEGEVKVNARTWNIKKRPKALPLDGRVTEHGRIHDQ